MSLCALVLSGARVLQWSRRAFYTIAAEAAIRLDTLCGSNVEVMRPARNHEQTVRVYRALMRPHPVPTRHVTVAQTNERVQRRGINKRQSTCATDRA